MNSRPTLKYFIILLISTIPLFALGLSNHGVWTADEPRVAEIGREMALSGNWAVPKLNQKPFLEEPPLYYASIAAVFRALGGSSDKTVRIPSAVFAFVGVLALFFLGSMLLGPRIGFVAAFIMATCGEYFRVAHWVIVDSALTCFIVLALAFFMSAYLSQNRGKRFLFYGLCYVCCALSFYSKGFIGVAIPGVAVLAFLVFDRNLREVLRMHLWLGVGIFAAVVLPWFLALWHQGGLAYLKIFLVDNHVQRFAGTTTGHVKPFYYYLTQFPGGFLPWTLLVVPAFYWSFKKTDHTDERARNGLLFAKCWFIAGFVLLSIASTKRVLYLMPLFAPISLLTAHYIGDSLKRIDFRKFEHFFNLAFGGVILAASLALIPVFFYASKKYALGASLKETVEIALFALVSTVLCLTAIVAYGRNKARFWIFSGSSVFVLLLLGLITVFPLLDRYKSFVPFCAAVRSARGGGETLYAYKPDETLRGAVPFYTGQFLKEVNTIPELEDAIEKEKARLVVGRDKRGAVEKEVLSTGKLSVAAKYGMDSDRSLVLFMGAVGNGSPVPAVGK